MLEHEEHVLIAVTEKLHK